MKVNNFAWLVGGEAGYGIMASGAMFSKACSRGGLHVFDYAEYPSLIRGGHNSYYIRVGSREIFSQSKPVNLIVALNKETVDRHLGVLTDDGALIIDSDDKLDLKGHRIYPVPLLALARQAGGDAMMRNTVAVGASLALVHYEFELLKGVIDDVFRGKGDDVIGINENAAKLGYDFVRKNYPDFEYRLEPIRAAERILVTGNEAFSLGALKAGCKFLAAYPMTPINSIIHYLASKQEEFNIIVKQPEDEIAGINMAIGASLAGVRSMTCTSGGGFCLMVEGLGLAGMTETPLVVIEGQRPGPATGLPTFTEQSDLKFIINAAHGEFPRIVMAPGDVDECFRLIQEAFYLAEKYQLTVLILSDKLLSESHKTTAKFDVNGENIRQGMATEFANYKRFAFTESGITPRSVPGQKNGIFMATSDEHGEDGIFNEEAHNRAAMMDKRMRKLDLASRDLPEPVIYGPEKAGLTIIAWGSTKGAVLEAFKLLENSGVSVNMLHLNHVWPFPSRKVAEVIKNSKMSMSIEGNKTAQMASLIREQTGLEVNHKLLKYDGRPFYPEDIKQKILEVLK